MIYTVSDVEKMSMLVGSTYFSFSNHHSFASFSVGGNTNFKAIKDLKELL